jgi:hypothetical protein
VTGKQEEAREEGKWKKWRSKGDNKEVTGREKEGR